jgi:glycosyltransferase involved in cell wall biosynthesis
MREKETEVISAVSVILLSYNGREYLQKKIDFLLYELLAFKKYELIIIDDGSTDGSPDLLRQFRDHAHIRLVLNPEQKGIPFSMNLGVGRAKYDYVIFCDQRQALSDSILKRILEPLKFKHVGAVSGCISCLDKEKKSSWIRKHENFVKQRESRAGSLIGVYGPFYAIRKQCYTPIPENIILDDLYLSLRILRSEQIELLDDCEITDENFSILYDYKRTRRYLSGLIQILSDKTIILGLNYKQRTMLIWHKYLRLLVPVLLFLCYVSLGLAVSGGIGFGIAFAAGTLFLLVSILPDRMRFQFRMKSMILLNAFYFVAFLDILLNDYFLRRAGSMKPDPLKT